MQLEDKKKKKNADISQQKLCFALNDSCHTLATKVFLCIENFYLRIKRKITDNLQE